MALVPRFEEFHRKSATTGQCAPGISNMLAWPCLRAFRKEGTWWKLHSAL